MVCEPRQARQTRPQLVVILADDSGSMAGEKAMAATKGIRELIFECQTRGPKGSGRGYFKLLLIRFSDKAEIDAQCDMVSARDIDPSNISLSGTGAQTNITAALQLAMVRLVPYMKSLENHPERAVHPLPLVLLFSDGGHNVGDPPDVVANEIKSLELDRQKVVIASAGVAMSDDGSDIDEPTLKSIASQEGCYLRAQNAQMLTNFIARVGSCGPSLGDVENAVKQLKGAGQNV